MDYRSVAGEYTAERVIEKSRFISYVAHAAGEEEARAFLDRVRKEHPLATHVCWAYISDRIGNLQRFSDDGEPQGTAGMPILGVLKAQELRETAVAVVRYFGGIKLGAGGLTRAYASLAAEGLSGAQKVLYTVCRELLIETDYPEVDPLLRFFGAKGTMVLMKEFGARALFTVAVKERRPRPLRRKSPSFSLAAPTSWRGRVISAPSPRNRARRLQSGISPLFMRQVR